MSIEPSTLIVDTLAALRNPREGTRVYEPREGAKVYERDTGKTYAFWDGGWVIEKYLVCPDCKYSVWVSPLDQDASLGQMYAHLLFEHAHCNDQRARDLLVKVKEVEESEL